MTLPTLPSREAGSCLHLMGAFGWIWLHANPGSHSYFFRPRQSSACDGDLFVNLLGNRHLPVEFVEELKMVSAGESDKGRGIRDDNHEPSRSSVRWSSSRSEAL